MADVYVAVPTPFLGGPIWNPLPATSPEAAGRPSLAPRPGSDPCRAAAERLGAFLLDRGPNPPVGLRGPGL